MRRAGSFKYNGNVFQDDGVVEDTFAADHVADGNYSPLLLVTGSVDSGYDLVTCSGQWGASAPDLRCSR